jgi:hypothetical protein
MEANEIRIRRVFVRPQGQLKMDDTLKVGDINEVVVEWEAGATANAGVATVDFDISIFSHFTGDLHGAIIAIPAVALNGNKHETIYEQVHVVPAAGFAPAGQWFEINVCLHQPENIVSFCTSPMFYVFP